MKLEGATLTAQHCSPQQLLQVRAVGVGPARSREAKKSAGAGQVGSDMEENPCQDRLSNTQHSSLPLITGVNGMLFKAGGITFSLSLSAVVLGSYRDSAVTYTHMCVLGGGSWEGLGQGQWLMRPPPTPCLLFPCAIAQPHTPVLTQMPPSTY